MPDVKGFVAKVQAEYGMRPVVPYEQPVRIGDVGTIGRDGAWNPVGTLRERVGASAGGIRTTKDRRGTWDGQSGRDVSIKSYAKGATSRLVAQVADAKARAEIEFSSSKGFVWAAKGVTIRSATEFGDVFDKIRRAYHNRKTARSQSRWEKDYAFIFAIGSASRFNALLAEQRGTSVVLNAQGKVGPPATAATLVARVSLDLATKELTQVRVAPASGVFYRAYRLNPSIFRRWDRERFEESEAVWPAPPMDVAADVGAVMDAPGDPIDAFIEVA